MKKCAGVTSYFESKFLEEVEVIADEGAKVIFLYLLYKNKNIFYCLLHKFFL